MNGEDWRVISSLHRDILEMGGWINQLAERIAALEQRLADEHPD